MRICRAAPLRGQLRIALTRFDHNDPGLWAYWINGHKAFGKPVLLGFNAGAYAHRLAEHTGQQVVTSALNALRGMYP